MTTSIVQSIADEQLVAMKDRYATCLKCAHAMTWLENQSLRVAVDCPECGAENQFGPGVFVPDFGGFTMKEVHRQRARKVKP